MSQFYPGWWEPSSFAGANITSAARSHACRSGCPCCRCALRGWSRGRLKVPGVKKSGDASFRGVFFLHNPTWFNIYIHRFSSLKNYDGSVISDRSWWLMRLYLILGIMTDFPWFSSGFLTLLKYKSPTKMGLPKNWVRHKPMVCHPSSLINFQLLSSKWQFWYTGIPPFWTTPNGGLQHMLLMIRRFCRVLPGCG